MVKDLSGALPTDEDIEAEDLEILYMQAYALELRLELVLMTELARKIL